MNVGNVALGQFLAVLVLVAALVLALIGHLSWPVAGLLMALAVARLT